MNYTEAVAAVAAGKVAWRTSWPATTAFIKKANSGNETVDQNDRPYPAPDNDKSATDWQVGTSRDNTAVNTEYHAGKDQDPSKVIGSDPSKHPAEK